MELASEYGLNLSLWQNFHDFANSRLEGEAVRFEPSLTPG